MGSNKHKCSIKDFNRIKEVLKGKHIDTLNELDSSSDVLDLVDFCELIDTYLNNIDFKYDVCEDDVYEFNDDLCLLFLYVDSLNLPSIFNDAFICSLLSRFKFLEDIDESRGVYDLIISDEIKNSKLLRSYLNNDLFVEQHKDNLFVEFLKEFYELIDELDEKALDKLKYIFHSSRDVLYYFLEQPGLLKKYLNSNMLSCFDKETLSLLYRTCLSSSNARFFQASEKSLLVISKMSDFVKENTGRNAEFFYKVLNFFYKTSSYTCEVFTNLLDEYYDNYYSKDVDYSSDKVFLELLNFILCSFSNINITEGDNICDIKSFLASRRNSIDKLCLSCFGFLGYSKIINGTFSYRDFRIIKDGFSLDSLKEAAYKIIYGIDKYEAYDICSKYGTYLKECKSEFLDSDKDIFNILSSIYNIFELDLNDQDKIRSLQDMLYEYIKKNSPYNASKNSSYVILSLLIDKMYMNVYESSLFDVGKARVLYYQRDVPVVDAGFDFNMIVSSINGVNEFFKDFDDMKKRYNTTVDSDNQGMCLSYISNENLGVISLINPLLGYTKFNDNSFNLMGIGDLYSDTDVISLRLGNQEYKTGAYFLTPKALINNTRFGYNEIIVDRFLEEDNHCDIKVQPSYVVCYMIDDKYMETSMYKKSIDMASQFGIPLVLIDVKSVKERERKVILDKEKELFGKRSVDKALLIEIVTRYMNNYSGSLTIFRSQGEKGNKWKYKADFSINGLNRFLKKVEKRFEDLDRKEVLEWFDGLKSAYNLERDRNQAASEVEEYAYSLHGGEFLLDDKIKFMSKVSRFADDRLNAIMYEEGLLDEDKVVHNIDCENDKELRVILNIANYLFKDSYVEIGSSGSELIFQSKKASSLSDEDMFNYGVIISYLIGNFNNNYFYKLEKDPRLDLDVLYDNDLEERLSSLSSVYFTKDKYFYKNTKLLSLANKITTMSDSDYIRLFQPLLNLDESEIKDIKYYNAMKKNPVIKSLFRRKNDIYKDFYMMSFKDKKKENIFSKLKKN